VSAVVTETGGLLSHAAIVAREVGIPAVVGAVEAMDRIEDGSPISVDGTHGTVEAPT
jgi:pyruvate,water dikinase